VASVRFYPQHAVQVQGVDATPLLIEECCDVSSAVVVADAGVLGACPCGSEFG
jgi:hypothetical protein